MGSNIYNLKRVLYGHLVGLTTTNSESDKARAEIELFTGEKLTFEVSNTERALLTPYLYNAVGLKGIATFDTLNRKFIAFKFDNIFSYNKSNIINGLESIKNVCSGFWDKFETDADISNYLKH